MTPQEFEFEPVYDSVTALIESFAKVNRAITDGRLKLEDLTREVEKKRRPWLIHDIGERMVARKRAFIEPWLTNNPLTTRTDQGQLCGILQN